MTEQQFIRKVKAMVRMHEGYKNYVYKDSRGYLTMGTGHRLTDEEKLKYKEGDRVDESYLEGLFEKDFIKHYKRARQITGFDSLTNQQKAALIDLTFNMGVNWTKKFPNLIRNIKLASEQTNPVLKKIYMRKAAGELKYVNAEESDFTESKYFTQVGYRAEDNFERLMDVNEDWDMEEVSLSQELGGIDEQENSAF